MDTLFQVIALIIVAPFLMFSAIAAVSAMFVVIEGVVLLTIKLCALVVDSAVLIGAATVAIAINAVNSIVDTFNRSVKTAFGW